ncbi:hypothetical protein CC86DRAFT_55003 [Ophiobolus disseminans]|uniref:Uncharacterized protein n=1 Tax=Ophiobolus disseminans TaxID=1469910 RepID=A0A6A6ZTK7_9PLEO|nr:hypothetical protein CC86DRAFT_55003 [Ophiobolus disseminans]
MDSLAKDSLVYCSRRWGRDVNKVLVLQCQSTTTCLQMQPQLLITHHLRGYFAQQKSLSSPKHLYVCCFRAKGSKPDAPLRFPTAKSNGETCPKIPIGCDSHHRAGISGVMRRGAGMIGRLADEPECCARVVLGCGDWGRASGWCRVRGYIWSWLVCELEGWSSEVIWEGMV